MVAGAPDEANLAGAARGWGARNSRLHDASGSTSFSIREVERMAICGMADGAMPSQRLLDEIMRYIEFSPVDAALMQAMGPSLRPHFPAIVDHFYAAIDRTPGAAAVFTGGAEQIERQKRLLLGWLEGLVGGVYDDAYVERRARIGRTHVRIALDQRYMFAGSACTAGSTAARGRSSSCARATARSIGCVTWSWRSCSRPTARPTSRGSRTASGWRRSGR
jgi:hypothetical protein